MSDGMTAQEWAMLLPGPPKATLATKIGDILGEMERLRFATVVSAVVLPLAWPGISEPEDEIAEPIIARIGRWCLTDHVLHCVGEGYWIAHDRLDEDDWLEHLLEKDWLYDPSDLTRALEQARAHVFPTEDRAQCATAIDTQLREAITSGYVVFDPTVLRRDHVYLVHRMRPEERAAFSAFLADQDFVARSS